ncbi:PGF-pre-PGF domain-containing protein [Methanolobus zinderi]|uniref:PGF-pre-PGF domain-containing protein n=1 Tax=Methanolobus zinderi TaxID=536044 RepID=A0A7D5EFI1_9EURY|nr:PGF-pre-PGF domain-containing protein [Methanolobus zinderi]QLC50716.1 PGF-pre-PGF domain-containing protein [Methanolobus zinderi]
MKKLAVFLMAILIAVGTIPTASAAASLSIGSISYDTNVVKDESITITSSVSAASVSGTLTVDVTLTDNSGQFTIPSPTQQVQFTSDGTKAVSWTVTATSTGTHSSPFTVSASGDDDSSTAKTASSAITVKDRPVLSVSSSTDISSVSAGQEVVLSYVVSNSASSGAADATNVKVDLALPSGWSLSSGTDPASLGTIAPGASSSGSWTVVADDPSSSNTLPLSVTSTIPGGTVTTSSSVVGPSTSSDTSSSSGGGGGGGGGGGASGEEYENIAHKAVKKVYMQKDVLAEYEFTGEENPISIVSFTPKLNAGMIDVTIEVLHDTSALVDSKPNGKVYRNMNIWVGKGGWASSSTISGPEVSFSVEKSWLEENDIDSANVRLMRYTTEWNQLETAIADEDSDFVYFTAKTPGFSPFAISAVEDTSIVEASEDESETSDDTGLQEENEGTEQQEETSNGLPGFSALTLIGMLAVAFVASRRK